LQALTSTNIAGLTAAQLSALSSGVTGIQALSLDDLPGLLPAQIGAFPVGQFGSLTSSQLAVLNARSLQA